jgi:hypothetical protein
MLDRVAYEAANLTLGERYRRGEASAIEFHRVLPVDVEAVHDAGAGRAASHVHARERFFRRSRRLRAASSPSIEVSTTS